MEKVLIVEDDRSIAELERDYLETAGYTVEIVADGVSGLDRALRDDFALVLLDVMLPKLDGFAVCRALRREKNTPVILVTAKSSDVDKIRGLGLGTDDYVVKPFSPAELTARVRAHITVHERLLAQKHEETIAVRDLKIFTLSHRVYVRGAKVTLTNRECELLAFLAARPNVVFSKEALYERVWGAGYRFSDGS